VFSLIAPQHPRNPTRTITAPMAMSRRKRVM
jgi:hypothetical protein